MKVSEVTPQSGTKLMHAQEENAKPSKQPALPKATMAWAALALACAGLLIGCVVGLSESPIAAAVVPLLFAVVTGAGGFHFVNSKLSTQATRQLVLYAAKATVCFMLACGAGLHLGITLREFSSSPRDASASMPATAEQLASLSDVEIVRLSALQRKLLLLGLDAESVSIFVNKYVKRYSSDVAARLAEGSPTAGDFDELEQAIQLVANELDALDEKRVPRTFAGLQGGIPTYLAHIKNLRTLAAQSGKHVPRDHYRRFLENISEDVESALEHKEGREEGTVATPAPNLNYAPLYALALVIDLQAEPIRRDDEFFSTGFDRDDIELLDTAIKLFKDTPGEVEESNSRRRRYSIKP